MRLPRIRSMLSLSRTVIPGLTLASASSVVGSICLLMTTQPPQIAGSTASNRKCRFIDDCPVSLGVVWYQMILFCVLLSRDTQVVLQPQTFCRATPIHY